MVLPMVSLTRAACLVGSLLFLFKSEREGERREREKGTTYEDLRTLSEHHQQNPGPLSLDEDGGRTPAGSEERRAVADPSRKRNSERREQLHSGVLGFVLSHAKELRVESW